MTLILCRNLFVGSLFIATIAGCGDGKSDVSEERLKSMAGGELKPVFPVSGTVRVDDEAVMGVNLYLYKEEGGGVLKECRTGEDGTYCWATRLPCDGLEAGSYRLAFKYIPKPKKNDTGEDLFKGKYANPMKNDFKLTVEEDSPQTDVDYDLKLK